jgi:menaquinol-cytochrome c reductase iron-sulfur subunit
VPDELERPAESREHGETEPHLPSPTIWPFAFAGGIALVLVGLVVNLWVTVIGAIIAVVFAFLWIREVTREVREAPPEPAVEPGPPLEEEEEGPARYGRAKFLEGATLGAGALIGGVVTLPVLGFAVAPAFVDQAYEEIDLGPLDSFPEGSFVAATFFYKAEGGNVSRRTAFVRNNGQKDGMPSFTIISNRCVHLGCPTSASGPKNEEERERVEVEGDEITLTPVLPAGFSCPCHGGAYDTEGNRTAGPPVRALDRYKFAIVDGNLVLGDRYAVGEVVGEGARAEIHAYGLQGPGEHVDGLSGWLYPIQPQDLR